MAVSLDWPSVSGRNSQRSQNMKIVICVISLLAFASAGGDHIKGGSRIIHQQHPLLRGSGLARGGQILSKRGGGGGLHHAAAFDPITQQQALSDPGDVVQEEIITTNGVPRSISRTYRTGQSAVPYGLSGLDYYSYPAGLGNRRQLSRKTVVTDNLSGLSPVGSRIKGGGLGGSGRLRFGNQPQVITKTIADPSALQFTLGDSQIASDPFGSRRNVYRVGQSLVPYGLSGLDYYSYPSQLFRQRPVTKGGLGGFGGVQTIPGGSISPGNIQFSLGDSQLAAIDPISQIVDQPQVTLTETVKGGSLGGFGSGGPVTTTTVTKSVGDGLGGGTQVTKTAVTKGGGIGGGRFVLGGGQLPGYGGRRVKTAVTKSVGGGLGGGSGNIHFVLGDGARGLGGLGQGLGQVTTVTKTSGGGLGGSGPSFVIGDGAGLGGVTSTTVTKSAGSGLGGQRQVTKTVTKTAGGGGIGGAQFVLGGGQLGGLRSGPRQVTKTVTSGGGLGGSGIGAGNIHFVLGDGAGIRGAGLGGGQRQVTKTVTKTAGDGLGGFGLGGGGRQVSTKTVTKSAGSGIGGAGLGGGNIQFVLGDGGGLGGVGLGGAGRQVTTKTVTKSAGDGLGGIGGIGLGGAGQQQVTTKTVTKSAGSGLGGVGPRQVTKTVTKSAGAGLGGAGIGGGNIQFVLGDGLGGLGGAGPGVTTTTVTKSARGGLGQVTKTAVTKSGGGGIGGAQFVLGGGQLGGRRTVKTIAKSGGRGLGGVGSGNIQFVLGDGHTGGLGGTGGKVTTTTVTKSTGTGLGGGGRFGGVGPVGQEKIITTVTGGAGDSQVLLGDGLGGSGISGFGLGDAQVLTDSGPAVQRIVTAAKPTFVTQVRGGDGIGTFGNRISQVQYIDEGRFGGLFPGVDVIGGSRIGDPRFGYYQRPFRTSGGPTIQFALGDDQGFSTLDGQGHVDEGAFDPQRLVLSQAPVISAPAPRVRAKKVTTIRKSAPLAAAGPGNIQFTLGDTGLGGSGLGQSQVAYIDDGAIGGLGLSDGGFGQRKVTTTTVTKPEGNYFTLGDSGVARAIGRAPVVRRVTTVRKPQSIAQDRIESTLVQDGLGSGIAFTSPAKVIQEKVVTGLSGGGPTAQFTLGDSQILSDPLSGAAPVVQTVQRVVDPVDSRQVQLNVDDVLDQSPFSQPAGVTRVKETTISTAPGSSFFGDPSSVAVTKVTEVAQSPVGVSSGAFSDGDLQQKLVSGDLDGDLGGYSPRLSFFSNYPYDVPARSILRSAIDPVQQVLEEQQVQDDIDFTGLYSPRVSFTSQYPYDVPAGAILRSVDPVQQVAQEEVEQILV